MKLYILPRKFKYLAMALFFVILIKRGRTISIEVENHERIHFRQQRELLWIPFLLWYGIEFLIRYAQYREWSLAYRNISFEREAHANDDNLSYRAWRKPFAWMRYL